MVLKDSSSRTWKRNPCITFSSKICQDWLRNPEIPPWEKTREFYVQLGHALHTTLLKTNPTYHPPLFFSWLTTNQYVLYVLLPLEIFAEFNCFSGQNFLVLMWVEFYSYSWRIPGSSAFLAVKAKKEVPSAPSIAEIWPEKKSWSQLILFVM